MKVILCTVFIFYSYQVSAFEVIDKHLINLSHAMSSFYMYSLSKGDYKYSQEYKLSFKELERGFILLKQKHPKFGQQFNRQWYELRPRLKFSIDEDGQLYLEGRVRYELMDLLIMSYSQLEKYSVTALALDKAFIRLHVNLELVGAMYLNSSSSYYGVAVSSYKDSELSLLTLCSDIDVIIDRIKSSSESEGDIKSIRYVETRWNYIKPQIAEDINSSSSHIINFHLNKLSEFLKKTNE